jgi:hypothetical protein
MGRQPSILSANSHGYPAMHDPAVWGLDEQIKIPIRERPARCDMSQMASNFDEFSGTTYAK